MTGIERAIDTLRFVAPSAKVTQHTVWSNGRSVRNYRGQDKSGAHVTNRTSAKGYRRMTMILIDEGAVAHADNS